MSDDAESQDSAKVPSETGAPSTGVPSTGAPSNEEGSPSASEAPQPSSPKPQSMRDSSSKRRVLLWTLAFVAPIVVIALDMVVILKPRPPLGLPSASASFSTPGSAPSAMGATSSQPGGAPSAALAMPTEGDEPVFDEDDSEGTTSPSKEAAPRHFATVEDAARGSCATKTIGGLNRQIVAEARCIDPRAFVPLPKRPNLVMGANVLPYLQAGARAHLLKALSKHKSDTLKINSALRTVAQQYLVWRWSKTKSCGVQLATLPGNSNHEAGLALDIAHEAHWRPALEKEDFRWLGSSDRVHFDYRGGRRSHTTSLDVLAFEKLWNRNHPDDRVTEDGRYGPAVEQRLKKAPADGFRKGASCKPD